MRGGDTYAGADKGPGITRRAADWAWSRGRPPPGTTWESVGRAIATRARRYRAVGPTSERRGIPEGNIAGRSAARLRSLWGFFYSGAAALVGAGGVFGDAISPPTGRSFAGRRRLQMDPWGPRDRALPERDRVEEPIAEAAGRRKYYFGRLGCI